MLSLVIIWIFCVTVADFSLLSLWIQAPTYLKQILFGTGKITFYEAGYIFKWSFSKLFNINFRCYNNVILFFFFLMWFYQDIILVLL